MRAFAEAWPGQQIVQQAVAQIPWGHSVRILDGVKSPPERLWYVQQTEVNGWSRNVLVHQIDSNLYARHGKLVTNFDSALPASQSDLARQLLKEPKHLLGARLDPETKVAGAASGLPVTQPEPTSEEETEPPGSPQENLPFEPGPLAAVRIAPRHPRRKSGEDMRPDCHSQRRRGAAHSRTGAVRLANQRRWRAADRTMTAEGTAICRTA